MGGEGSGRKPSMETLVKRNTPQVTPIGTGIFFPNTSNVQTAALKTSAAINVNASNSFSTISKSGESDIVADSSTDTLTIVANGGVRVTTNATTDTLTFDTSANAQTRAVTFIIDGGGSTITTGIKGDLYFPSQLTIQGVLMLADQSGSIVVDIWKDSYGNYPPTVADTITASAIPTISGASKSKDLTLTGWTTTISSDDTLRFNVDSVTAIQRVTIVLYCITNN